MFIDKSHKIVRLYNISTSSCPNRIFDNVSRMCVGQKELSTMTTVRSRGLSETYLPKKMYVRKNILKINNNLASYLKNKVWTNSSIW